MGAGRPRRGARRRRDASCVRQALDVAEAATVTNRPHRLQCRPPPPTTDCRGPTLLALLTLRCAAIGNVRTLIDLIIVSGYVARFALARFIYTSATRCLLMRSRHSGPR
jgi:hypothetical protein